MAALVIAEHDNASLKGATLNTITAAVQIRNAFRTPKLHDRSYGTAETDKGINLPRQYWYATGRDEALERQVARVLEQKVSKT